MKIPADGAQLCLPILEQRFSGRHIYIHVPVCRYRCDYCDFFTRTHVAPERQRDLIERIAVQAEAIIDLDAAGSLATLYVGGGTPSALEPDAWNALLRLISRLLSRFADRRVPSGGKPGGPATPVPEVTVELNPEDITETRCRELRSAGVNRVSVGVQTFSSNSLQTIGRHIDVEHTYNGVETLATHWDGEWSSDLIVGIPGATAATVRHDIHTLLQFEPHHLSVYELGLEPATVLGHAFQRGRLHRAPETDILSQLDITTDLLRDAGFRRYEISSYAHPGCESRHNLAYWRMAPHLGLGPGAVGTFPLAGGPSPTSAGSHAEARMRSPTPAVHRVTNTRSFERFLRQCDFGMEIEAIAPRDVIKEYCMMAFRTVEGIDTASFTERAGAPFTEVCAGTMTAWPEAFIPARRITTPPLPEDTPATGIAIAEPYRNVIDRILVDLFAEIDAWPLRSS